MHLPGDAMHRPAAAWRALANDHFPCETVVVPPGSIKGRSLIAKVL